MELWRVGDWERWAFPQPSGDIPTDIALNPDGSILAQCHRLHGLSMFDVASRRPIPHPDSLPRSAFSLAFRSDGAQLALSDFSGEIHMYKCSEDRLIETIRIPPPWNIVYAMKYGPEGRSLAVIADESSPDRDGALFVFDLTVQPAVERFHIVSDYDAVALQPDGRRMACSVAHPRTYHIEMRELGDGGLLWSHEDHHWNIRGLSFNPAGTRLASTSADRVAHIRELVTGTTLSTIHHLDLARDSKFLPDGRRIIAATDSGIEIWRLKINVDSNICTIYLIPTLVDRAIRSGELDLGRAPGMEWRPLISLSRIQLIVSLRPNSDEVAWGRSAVRMRPPPDSQSLAWDSLGRGLTGSRWLSSRW